MKTPRPRRPSSFLTASARLDVPVSIEHAVRQMEGRTWRLDTVFVDRTVMDVPTVSLLLHRYGTNVKLDFPFSATRFRRADRWRGKWVIVEFVPPRMLRFRDARSHPGAAASIPVAGTPRASDKPGDGGGASRHRVKAPKADAGTLPGAGAARTGREASPARRAKGRKAPERRAKS